MTKKDYVLIANAIVSAVGRAHAYKALYGQPTNVAGYTRMMVNEIAEAIDGEDTTYRFDETKFKDHIYNSKPDWLGNELNATVEQLLKDEAV